MNKILLLGINARYSHPAAALYYLKEHVAGLPWNVALREFTIHASADEIIQCIREEKADCIAFSVYIWNTGLIQKVLSLIGDMRARPKILLGGPDAGYNPEAWFAGFPFIDFIIAGHGEAAFRQLLENNFHSEQKVLRIGNPEFSQIKFPYTESDLKSFANRKIYYESGRGCAFKCTYCLSSREDQKLEFRETDQVKSEIDIIMKHKPEIIKFIDRTFNVNSYHAKSIWKYIIEKYPSAGTRFHFEIHPDLLKQDDFMLLETCPANLFQFEIGIQSTCPEAIGAVNRKGNWQDIKPAVNRIIGLGTIPVHVDLIAGLPFENYKTFRNSFNEVYSLYSNHFQLGYLKVLHGTEMRESANGWGIIYTPEPPYEIIENKWIDKDEMRKIKIIAKLVDLLYNSQSYNRTLENLILLYDSPFDFYSEFADMKISQAVNGNIAWNNMVEDLIAFASGYIKDSEFIKDCIRWDWCSAWKTNRYPKILKNDWMRQKRKELLASLQDGHLIKDAEFLTEELLRRSKFFAADTEKFRSKYLAGKSYVLFPGDRFEKVFLD